MKKFNNIFFSLSFLFLFFGLSTPLSSHSTTFHSQTTSYSSAERYIPQSLPGNTVIQIRHRSPHEVEKIVVPAPNEAILYIITLSEFAPEYFSKWKNYFSIEEVNLPCDQAYPPTRSLRAPPINC
jgi:hypothetical protein